MPESDRFAQQQQTFYVGSGDPEQTSPTYAAYRKSQYAYRSWAVESYAESIGLCIYSRAILAGILAWQYRFKIPWFVQQSHPLSRLVSWTGRSAGSVRRYRARLVKCGLLHYRRGAKGRAATYAVVIPAAVSSLAARPTADGTMATPFSTGYPHLSTSGPCTHMARPVLCSSVRTDKQPTDRTIAAQVGQDVEDGEWFGMQERFELYEEIHSVAAATAHLRWDYAHQQALIQAIDDALYAGRDRDWLCLAIQRAYENALDPPKTLAWFVPVLHGMIAKGIPDPRVIRAKREAFGVAWKISQNNTPVGEPTYRAIIAEMQKANIYDFFLDQDTEALIISFSDKAAYDEATADYNRRAWRRELERLRKRYAEGLEPFPPPRKVKPRDETADALPAVVGATLASSESRVVRAVGAGIARDAGIDDVHAENERRSEVRRLARAAMELELEVAKDTPREPEPVGMSREEVQAEIDALLATRGKGG